MTTSVERRVEDVYRDLNLPTENPWDSSLPYIAINMVSSLDGKTSIDGVANDIGGAADRRVMRNIRSKFDAVLRGAGTLRAEKISLGVTEELAQSRRAEGREPQPLDLILSNDGASMPLDTNLINITPGRVAVLIPAGATPVTRSDIRSLQMPASPDGTVDLVRAMQLLKSDHGVQSLLLEGGPTLNNSFISANIVNELFLTIAPLLLATSDSPLTLLHSTKPSKARQRRLQLASAYVSGDELFLRYTVPEPT